MSQKVAVYHTGESSPRYRLKHSKAEKKVRMGGYRWRLGEKHAIEDIPPVLATRVVRATYDGAPAQMSDWQPTPSAHFIVMQLRTRQRRVE